jgi:bla regulator protein BlaR1
MSDFFLYLFKASLVQAAVCGVYWLFLRKETFHQANRLFLLSGFLSSLLLPLVVIPGYGLPAEDYIQPASQSITAGYFWLLQQQASMHAVKSSVSFDWLQLIASIYAGGVTVFVLLLLGQFWSISRVIRASQLKSESDYTLAINPQVAVPFSFFRYVVLNPELYEAEAREHILKHEQIHVAQRHSWDILMTEVITALFWFNPFAWWLKSFSKLNLEYLADQGALQAGVSRRNYQLNLLKVSLGSQAYGLTNYFNQSLLKTRIQMMNRPTSLRLAMAKYLLILPFLTGLLFLFQTSQATVVQEKVAALTNRLQQLTQSDNLAETASLSTTEPRVDSGKAVMKRTLPTTQSVKRTIKGIIEDARTGQPLAGVYVCVRGYTDGVTSDAKGQFSIEVQGNDIALVFLHADYSKRAIAIPAEREEMKVLLEKGLFKNNKFGPPLYEPLYLLDGKEISPSELDALNQQKIISIGIFKDSSAIAAYGEKGRNGVIKILTKPAEKEQGSLYKGLEGPKGGRFSASWKLAPESEWDVRTLKEGIDNKSSFEVSKRVKEKWNAKPLLDGGDFNGRPGQLTYKPLPPISFRLDSTSGQQKQSLYFIDGKKVEEKAVHNLNPNDIESIKVTKDQEAIKTLGQEGEAGVVEIKLKAKKK